MASSGYAQLDGRDGNDIESPRATMDLNRDEADHTRSISPILNVPRRKPVPTSTSPSPEPDLEPRRQSNATAISGLTLHTIESLDAAHNDAAARQTLVARQEEAASRLSMESRLKFSLSPSMHHEKYPNSDQAALLPHATFKKSDTSRVYSFWRQTRRLWRLAAAEWLITAALCGAFAGALVYFGQQLKISSGQLLVFNSITTGLTFLLGVNLTASMRSYAKLLRWLLLSLCWQPLETFDLMVRCESLLNCCKLAWAARKHKSKRLRFLTIGMSLFWLLITLALTLFVGMIGLTYSIDPSDSYVNTTPGTVQITDFSKIETADSEGDAGRIQEWGIQGVDRDCGYFNMTNQWCYKDGKGRARRRLSAWNPDDLSLSMVSHYSIDAKGACVEWNVTSGGMGYNTTIGLQSGKRNITVRISLSTQNVPGPGGIVAWSSRCRDCTTDRITWNGLFLAQGPTMKKAQYFECTSSLEDVYEYNYDNSSWVIAPREYQFNNATARMLAGAVGWTGNVYIASNTSWQGSVYKNYSVVTNNFRKNYGPDSISAQAAGDFIATYAIKTITYLDMKGTGLNQYKLVQGLIPLRAQNLSVTWRNAILLLAGIPALQLVACILVFAVANRAIIKDDSALSMAKLYFNLLRKYELDDRGCMLRGDEIVEYIGARTGHSQGPMVTYGWQSHTDEDGNEVGHLDVFEQRDRRTPVYQTGADVTVNPRERLYVRSQFKRGIEYDGVGLEAEMKQDDTLRKRAMPFTMEES